jgi:hypothetical protein
MEWIARRAPAPPATLTRQVLAALGRDADADETQTAELCLAAAARSLDGLLSESRFTRESALDLLAIDALTTYAYEHASQAPDSERRLQSLAERGAQLLGQLMTQRV